MVLLYGCRCLFLTQFVIPRLSGQNKKTLLTHFPVIEALFQNKMSLDFVWQCLDQIRAYVTITPKCICDESILNLCKANGVNSYIYVNFCATIHLTFLKILFEKY